MPTEHIKYGDVLYDGTDKLNKAIDQANKSESDSASAVSTANQAVDTANTAETKSDSVQEQFNQVVIEGDSSVEAAQARVKADGSSFSTLQERLNSSDSQLAQKANQSYEENKKAVAPFYGSEKPMFTIVDDDAQTRFLSITKPILDARNIKISLAVITDKVGTSGYMTKEQLLQLQSEGHEIVSHSTNHQRIYTDDTTPDEEIEASLRDSQQWLMNNGFNGYDTFVIPYGSANARSKKIISKYYKYSLLSSGGNITSFPFDNLKMPRQGIRANEDFNTVLKPVIDSCVSKNGLQVFLTHSGIEAEITSNYLTQAIDYVINAGGVFLPFNDAMGHKGNALSIGDYESDNKFFVSPAGKISGGNLLFGGLVNTVNGIDNPQDFYVPNKITVTHIDNKASGSLKDGGILITNTTDIYYTFQLFINQNKMFSRRWDVGANTWKPWQEYVTTDQLEQQVGSVIYNKNLITNASSITMDDPITTYEEYKTTVLMIGPTKDTFKGTGGVMRVERLAPYYSYATFKPSNENTIYVRKWNDGATQTWGSWGV